MLNISNFFKRIFDLTFSFIALILLLPIWIVIPILIKIDSKGPVFFRQERRTKNGKVFNMLKFRSMIVNAEKMGSGLFNYKGDSRVTKVGRFLRDSSLDEVPQIINILKGDMSIVGPRPCVKYELGDFETLNKKYKKRFNVKAGLTGYAQINGRNDIDWDDKVEFDNEYIDLYEKYGIFIDLKIIFKTILSVFKRKNICENKVDDNLNDEDSAKKMEEEIIRLAHISD